MSGRNISNPTTYGTLSGSPPNQNLSLFDGSFSLLYGVATDSGNWTNYGVDTGGVNSYSVTLTPAAASYQPGMMLYMTPSNTNTGASVINVNGLGSKSIVSRNNAALIGGELVSGFTVALLYDGTSFRVYPAAVASAPVNILNNGQTQIWQRNTTFAGLGGGSSYTSDRWKYITSAGLTGRVTASQQSAGITGTSNYPDTEYCLRLTVTTAQASLAAGDFAIIQQFVEQQFARRLYDNPTSVSILLRSSITGTFCVALRNNNAGTPNQSLVQDCVITSANTWQRFTFQGLTTMPTGTGTWGSSDTDYSYTLSVCVGSGSTFQGSVSNAWQTGNFVADSNQTNLLATNGATFDMDLVQHEPGAFCNPFVWVPWDQDWLRCNRYYFKTYEYTSFAGLATGNGSIVPITLGAASTFLPVNIKYTVTMRTAGTRTYYSPVSGTANHIYDNASTSDRVFGSDVGSVNFVSDLSATTAFSAGNLATVHLITDSDF